MQRDNSNVFQQSFPFLNSLDFISEERFNEIMRRDKENEMEQMENDYRSFVNLMKLYLNSTPEEMFEYEILLMKNLDMERRYLNYYNFYLPDINNIYKYQNIRSKNRSINKSLRKNNYDLNNLGCSTFNVLMDLNYNNLTPFDFGYKQFKPEF